MHSGLAEVEVGGVPAVVAAAHCNVHRTERCVHGDVQRQSEPALFPLRAESGVADARGFEPATSRQTFRIAASDYLDPLFLPQLVTQIKSLAPNCGIDIHPLSADADYRAHLAGVLTRRAVTQHLSPTP